MSDTPLADRHCTPLRGAEHCIRPGELGPALATLPGWSAIEDGAAIGRSYAFSDYYHTMAFVNALAYVAHREDHHPDLGVHYNRCVVRFSTHDCGGVTANDLICAAKADALFAESK
ncbi:MAG: 4a-hydroxytetrahydrobiopterin dehydratase [Xanthomonadales bacterium]|nr:4a-hydroxytetrahydrobiopterin dehydratase [Xanthomonadales bacterium]